MCIKHRLKNVMCSCKSVIKVVLYGWHILRVDVFSRTPKGCAQVMASRNAFYATIMVVPHCKQGFCWGLVLLQCIGSDDLGKGWYLVHTCAIGCVTTLAEIARVCFGLHSCEFQEACLHCS